ncbi:MAG TPA: hypothetical protein PLX15_01525 [Candidatus Woesearchaeota archaeon]|nr:hypothetical protein [Candidatus Woesearchaeota archaeon]
MKKSQSATELAIVIGIMMAVMVVFVMAIFSRYYEFAKLETRRNLEDVASYIESEIKFAIKSEAGFVRTFSLPQNIAGLGYSITIDNPKTDFSVIIIKYNNNMGSDITIPFDYNITANNNRINTGSSTNKLNKSTSHPNVIQLNDPHLE